MRILIIGRGHVGTYLHEHIPGAVLWDGRIGEVTPEMLDTLAPAVVINAAGKTDLAWCEAHQREAYAVNTAGPDDLLSVILHAKPRMKLIHISSGCIWQGPYDAEGKSFGPLSPPNPACYYSETKAQAERLLMDNPGILSRYLVVLRPRQIYSPECSPRNTLFKLLKYPGLIDTPNSMTSIDTLLKTILYIVETPRVFDCPLNVSDVGFTTPYHVGVLLAEAGLRPTPHVISKRTLDSWHKPKRVDVVMADPLFDSLIHPPAVEEELRRMIGLFKARLK